MREEYTAKTMEMNGFVRGWLDEKCGAGT